MEDDLLKSVPLFRGISEISALLSCLGAKEQTVSKGTVILPAGEPTDVFGLVLRGGVQIESIDFWGNRSIFDRIAPGQSFGEAYALRAGEPMLVSAVASEQSQILLLRAARLLHPCENSCGFHHRLIENLLVVVAEKNRGLTGKIFHTAPKTIRGRLISYLSAEAARQNTETFEIGFDRQALADYLRVDRSALSKELGLMRREGLLECQKNRFVLHAMS